MEIRRKIPSAPSVRRLPSYLTIVKQLQHEGNEHISGALIAREMGLEPIQIRKDLAITGITGKPRIGYPAGALADAIERFLGWYDVQDAVLAGAGNLGSALMGYREFQSHCLNFVAAFDTDSRKIGAGIHGIHVLSMETLETEVRRRGVKIAVLTVPAEAAQAVTDILVRAGIEGIWNFTNVKLKVPGNVVVQREDLSSGYAMLSVMMKTRNRTEKESP
ncbi:MAG: redox-sensing transcriptional repressor Rex [Treponema sp.]|jgi:redox-sensing transcriptional repressor|nr:redox-sensing transcriptional repressor Rex [Treponema sp.]